MAKRNIEQQNRYVRSVVTQAAGIVRENLGKANDDCNAFDRCLRVASRIFDDVEDQLSAPLDKITATDVQGAVFDIQAIMLGAEQIGNVPDCPDYGSIARKVWETLEPITEDLDSLYWPQPAGEEDMPTAHADGKAIIAPKSKMDEVDLEDMRELIREASGNIERLARLAAESADIEGHADIIPQLMERLTECNSAILSASGRDSLTLEEGYEKVFGRFGPGFDAVFDTAGA